jgi:hypothetical protein
MAKAASASRNESLGCTTNLRQYRRNSHAADAVLAAVGGNSSDMFAGDIATA